MCPITPLHLRTGATASDVGVLRRGVRRWLAAVIADPDTVDDLVLAVSEALENAVDHAFRDRETGTMTLTAELSEGTVIIRVADDGRWQARPADAGYRGRGLDLMESLADTAVVETGDQGTAVTLRRGASVLARVEG